VLDKPLPVAMVTHRLPFVPPQTQSLGHNAHLDKMPEHGVAIYIADNKTPLIVSIRERLVIGRRQDGSHGSAADFVDLTPYEAYKNGVSRDHATLIYKNNVLHIEDMGSVNGTRMNGQRLKAQELYEVLPGTMAVLGQLRLYLYY
jgi:pSer/pThr/pTyr-binding forkhead associated (FHA) protein